MFRSKTARNTLRGCNAESGCVRTRRGGSCQPRSWPSSSSIDAEVVRTACLVTEPSICSTSVVCSASASTGAGLGRGGVISSNAPKGPVALLRARSWSTALTWLSRSTSCGVVISARLGGFYGRPERRCARATRTWASLPAENGVRYHALPKMALQEPKKNRPRSKTVSILVAFRMPQRLVERVGRTVVGRRVTVESDLDSRERLAGDRVTA